MLLVGGASERAKQAQDRRHAVGCNCTSDVWSLGCLLYELFAGRFLFQGAQDDWVKFFVTVTSPGETDKQLSVSQQTCVLWLTLLSLAAEHELLQEAALSRLAHRGVVEPLLRHILLRDAHRRPLDAGLLHLVDKAIAGVLRNA